MSPFSAFEGSMQDFRQLPGEHLLDRLQPFFDWQQTRRAEGVWPLGRSTETGPHSVCQARTDEGQLFHGVNLASQDYLSLASHPDVITAAVTANRRFGVHSAGSPALVGNTCASLALETEMAAFLGMPHVTLYPTGWAAGFGVIKGLVRQDDHIVMDRLAHACLLEGAHAATGNLHYFAHNDPQAARECLNAIRARDTSNGILVVTESLFSMDSDTPDLARLQALAHEYNATLLVDAAHDLGCLGDQGWGHIGAQGMRGKIDLVMGSFSKTFAANGGFVACAQRSVKEYLRYYSSPHTFSNALSPAQAAVASACLGIITSKDGDALRARLMANILHLRQRLDQAGLQTYGAPSPIVCVPMGSERLARLVSRQLPGLGVLCNLVEYPAVAKGAARFRLQVMAGHQATDIDLAVQRLSAAHRLASPL